MQDANRYGQVLEIYNRSKVDSIAIWDLERKVRWQAYPGCRTTLRSGDLVTFRIDAEDRIALDVTPCDAAKLPPHIKKLF